MLDVLPQEDFAKTGFDLICDVFLEDGHCCRGAGGWMRPTGNHGLNGRPQPVGPAIDVDALTPLV